MVEKDDFVNDELGVLPNLTPASFEDFMKEPIDKNEKGSEKDEKNNEKNASESQDPGATFVPPLEEDDVNWDKNNIDTGGNDNLFDEKEDNNDPYKILGNFANEIGIINFDENEYKPEEGKDYIIRKFEETINERVKEIESSYPQEIKSLLDNWREGVPLRDLIEAESRIQELNSITLEELRDNKEYQKEVISAYLQTQDYTDEEIVEKIEKYEDAGILDYESSIALDKLKKQEEKKKKQLIEESKKNQENLQKQAQEEIERIKNSIMNKKSLFEGFEYTDKQKQKVFDAITKPVAKTKDGKPVNLIGKAQLEDPDFWEKVAFMVINNWDFKNFKNQAKKEYAAEVKKKMNTFVENNNGKNSKVDVSAIKAAIENIKRKQRFI